jgi:hypothetical protein
MGLFGIGDGKIELQLKNPNVPVGGTLEGTAILTLNKDVKGKEVVAILYAERTTESLNTNGQMNRRSFNIYSKSQVLDGDKLYAKSNGPYQYNFTFVIPQTGGPSAPSGMLGALTGVVGGMAGGGIVRWYVKVELKHEAMLSFPIERKQEIGIMTQPTQPPPMQ